MRWKMSRAGHLLKKFLIIHNRITELRKNTIETCVREHGNILRNLTDPNHSGLN